MIKRQKQTEEIQWELKKQTNYQEKEENGIKKEKLKNHISNRGVRKSNKNIEWRIATGKYV